MRRAIITLSALLSAPLASAQDLDGAVSRCLRLGAAPSPAARAVMERWLPPRPAQLSLSAGFAVGPEGAPHASATLRGELAAWSPLYLEAQARALLGRRLWVSADLLVGVELSAHRGTRWRGTDAAASAPWGDIEPSDPVGVERWMRERERDCGVSQGAWRLLGGARMLSPVDGVGDGPPLQFAVALGVSRSATAYAEGTRTGLDVAILALLDPARLQPGVLGRVSASWGRLLFGLDGAWVFGPQGYAFVSLDVGFRLSR